MTSLRPQFSKTISKLGGEDSNLFVIVGDISHGLLSDFRLAHPERYRNIGICEPAMISISAGLNAAGFNPVVHTIAPFLIERAFEQIKLDFGYQQLDCNLISVGSSFDYAKLGCSHHSYIDAALISSIEGSRVFVPGSEKEFDLLFSKNYNSDGVKYFRLTENGHGFDTNSHNIVAGKNLLLREGSDLTIVALGPSLRTAIAVADSLGANGVSVEVVYAHTFKPFDLESVSKSVRKTSNLVTISQLSSVGGLGAMCLESISGKFPFKFLNFEIETFIRGYGDTEDLNKRAKHSTSHISGQVLEMLK